MAATNYTRLRWGSSSDKNKLVRYLEALPYRVQIYEILWDGKEYVMFFVPDDSVSIEVGKYGKLK